MSTFSGLNTAYSGLVAARAGLDAVGQNIANANTSGYTRQRVTTSAIGPLAQTGLFSGGARPGQGVSVDGIARLGDGFLDAQVRASAAVSGYWSARADGMSDLESTLHEPGANGLSAQLQGFWAGWQDVSNHTGEPASAGVLLQQAGALGSQIAQGYQDVDTQWSQIRGKADQMTSDLNAAASRVADLNGRIRSTLAAGGSVNELLDQRSALTARVANLVGGTVRELGDGTAEVLVGGNAIVSGDTSRPLKVVGA